jgi:hypothetical protein
MQLILGSIFVLIGISIYFYIINRELEKGDDDWIGYFCGIGFVVFGLFLIIQQICSFSIYDLAFFLTSKNK